MEARNHECIERLHKEFKRRIKTQTVLPSTRNGRDAILGAPRLGQITMRKVEAGNLGLKPIDQPIDLAA